MTDSSLVAECIAILEGLLIAEAEKKRIALRVTKKLEKVVVWSDSSEAVDLIVLDLDETLVCAYETSCLPEIVKSHAIKAEIKCFELECFSVEKDAEGKPWVSHVTVFERPGLREFLKKISECADLVLFTAGLEGYARPVVDRIDVDNKFSLRLYRPSPVSTLC
ncbi:uncharacterized protein C2F7.02c-like [Asparagus officinalis]|uniref:uncharacterized protein C2F7.02c-like n=1 Tax=Asparagus officinalis TaxID=4686 RepID=UPI00098E8223|nr:uncharacterized protein C2F7.02c-like [Asparagus officinalis]